MKRGVRRAGLIAALAAGAFAAGLGAALLFIGRPPSPADQPPADRPSIEGDFALLDSAGRTLHWADINHRQQLVFFGFTHCPEACPVTLMNASTALADLGEPARNVGLLFISVDPERDSPEVVGAYARNFGPRVTGLTGNVAGIAAAARAFHVSYAKMPAMADGDYMVNHSASLFLLGARDEILDIIPYGASAGEIAAAVRRHLP